MQRRSAMLEHLNQTLMCWLQGAYGKHMATASLYKSFSVFQAVAVQQLCSSCPKMQIYAINTCGFVAACFWSEVLKLLLLLLPAAAGI
jgi:hypothetical protein